MAKTEQVTPVEETTPIEEMLDSVTIEDWEQANASLAAMAMAKAKMDEIEAQYKQIKIQSEKAMADELAPLEAEIKRHEDALNVFAVQHRDEFGTKKSRELVSGTIGFRLSKPSVSLLPKFTEKVALLLINKSAKFRKSFIRFKANLNKDAILASFNAKDIDEITLKGFGVEIKQEEGFFAEANGDRFSSAMADLVPDALEEAA